MQDDGEFSFLYHLHRVGRGCLELWIERIPECCDEFVASASGTGREVAACVCYVFISDLVQSIVYCDPYRTLRKGIKAKSFF